MTYEQAHELAIHATLRPVAAVMAEIGWHATLASLTEEQIKGSRRASCNTKPNATA